MIAAMAWKSLLAHPVRTAVLGVGFGLGNLAELDRFVEVRANLTLSFSQTGGENVFQDGAISAQRGDMRDASAHDAGANDGDGVDLPHYGCPPFSRCASTPSRLLRATRKCSITRFRSSASMKGMEALMRRRVVTMSST